MAKLIESETQRLHLRQWQPADRVPLSALGADADVMEFFPALLTRQESDGLAGRCQSFIEEHGWGPWAVELKETQEFIGFVGLNIPPAELPFSPCVEILWRLGRPHWGKGYASEAAKEALRFGFEVLDLPEIVSFAVVHNQRSRAVMERLGMQPRGIFEHPRLPLGSNLRRHCLYRLSSAQYAPVT